MWGQKKSLQTEIILPTWHDGQVRVWNNRGRFNVVRCGRRWGKSKMLITLAADTAMKGKVAGIFTPQAAQWREPYDEIKERTEPIIIRSDANKGRIRLSTRGQDKTGGKLDFWHTDDNMLAGRGPSYHRIVGDETAFAKAGRDGKTGQMVDIWKKNLRPTLLTTRGEAWFFSTPFGDDPDNFFWQLCNNPAHGFTEHHAPSSDSPYCPPDELELIRTGEHPLVFKQEYLAEFVSWRDAAFFQLDWFLGDDGLPLGMPTKCDVVFAVMDCAVKSGSTNDGTGVVYCAYTHITRTGKPQLVFLDYELESIDAANLVNMAPRVLARGEELARECGARQGFFGVHVEDAAGGAVLLQQAKPQGWPMYAIPSDLMMKGKDERAMISGGPAYRREVKFSTPCFEKTVEWKGRTQNHLLHQLTSFRLADKEAYKRPDDLLDCATYSIALSLVESTALG